MPFHLINEVKMHPLDSLSFPSDQCQYEATKNDHLLQHLSSIHEVVKYPCDQCDYKATHKGSLLTHLKSKHEGVNCQISL